ncbi:hypothetical protein GA8_03425 [Geobacillus sp. A8]|nr:hypothetical protein GA8_03425 [Geobacillus sp. A8]
MLYTEEKDSMVKVKTGRESNGDMDEKRRAEEKAILY